MLSLSTKQGEKLDLYKPLISTIEATNGPQVANQLEPVLKRLQQYRDNIIQVAGYRNDNVALEKLANESKEYISIWNNISQSFTFGKAKESINIRFTWYDSYSREKKVTTNAATERLAILYNLAIIYSQIGANLAGLPDDHLKDAANNFLKAAWILEKIKVESGGLRSPDFGLDLGEQNLHMCSYIMRAEAQRCAHQKLKITRPDKYGLLAKLAIQASAYYGNAYSYASTPPLCKSLDKKRFTGILQFNETSFIAQAYYWDALEKQKISTETGEGMGKAVASIQKANKYLDGMKKHEKSLSPAILGQYKELCEQLQDKKNQIESQNSKIYHENVPASATEIDCMPFGQPISIEPELNKSYEGQETLQRMVPPAVRELEDEYKKEVGLIMNQIFEIAKKNNDAHAQLLTKHGLPAALHAVSGEQSLPEDLWQRIKQCKERGGINGLIQTLNNVGAIADSNNNAIQKLFAQLKQEEEEDKAMRTKYGSAWSRLPSNVLNQTMVTQANYYKQKFDQGQIADQKVRDSMNQRKPLLDMLDLDKEALIARIPKSANAKGQLPPAASK
jgi:programmed cell death 6-interacting protein